MISIKEKISTEQEFISLLLTDLDLVAQWMDEGPKIEYFEKIHYYILEGIAHANSNDASLTREIFSDFLDKTSLKKLEKIEELGKFHTISTKLVDSNNFFVLRKKIYDAYVGNSTITALEGYQQNIEKGETYATTKLLSSLQDIIEDKETSNKKLTYESISSYSSEFLKVIDKKLSEDPNKSTIRCHIKEIDQTLGVGFAPGTLVLFTADVGGGKSTIMLNIAFNIWEKEGKNVLFAPLEMPREKMYQKFLSRLLRIPFSKIEHPHLLNKVELEAIRNSPAKIEQIEKEKGGKFYIIDAPEQISVPALKKVIEKHISLFQPHLVVVDYIANLITDKDSYRKDMRNDLEIGNMLKSLRSMGRPNAVTKEGFCVVSGAQIGRDALKRIRQAGGKASFNSEDIRGSHEYSADSDAIYAQMPDPQQPDQKIFIHVIKSRYGKKSFENGAQRAVLNVNHEICLIQSASEMFSTFAPSGDDILKSLNAVNNLELDEETREPDPLEEILNA